MAAINRLGCTRYETNHSAIKKKSSGNVTGQTAWFLQILEIPGKPEKKHSFFKKNTLKT